MLGIFHYTIPKENCAVIGIQFVKFAKRCIYVLTLELIFIESSEGLVSKKSRDHSIFALRCSKLYKDTNSTECLIR